MSFLSYKINSKYVFIIYPFLIFFLSLPFAFAGMEIMDDDGLDSVCAAGLSLVIKDFAFNYNMNARTCTDTDTGNSLALHNISYDDGAGGPAIIDTGDGAITFDLFTINDLTSPVNGTTFFAIEGHDLQTLVYYSIDNVVFAGTDIGSMFTGNIAFSDFDLYIAPNPDGSGIAGEFDFKMHTDEIIYTYNDAGDNLKCTGTIWSQTAGGLPEDPSTWAFSDSFALGDVNNANPATIDVLTLDNGSTSIIMNTPVRGSIRVENINFGGTDFGPIAIDGINMHHFHVMIKPGFL